MKKILIALCGKTPQIITETLYALHLRQSFPDRVVILTTDAGRALCLDRLLHPEHGRLPALLQGLRRVAPCLLRAKNILTPPGTDPVTDIHTEEDSRRFLELCLKTVFTLSRDSGCEIIFSIAGGRKTMSAALVLAAQCYARPQDSMFHILVPQELEADPFFLSGGRAGRQGAHTHSPALLSDAGASPCRFPALSGNAGNPELRVRPKTAAANLARSGRAHAFLHGSKPVSPAGNVRCIRLLRLSEARLPSQYRHLPRGLFRLRHGLARHSRKTG